MGLFFVVGYKTWNHKITKCKICMHTKNKLVTIQFSLLSQGHFAWLSDIGIVLCMYIYFLPGIFVRYIGVVVLYWFYCVKPTHCWSLLEKLVVSDSWHEIVLFFLLLNVPCLDLFSTLGGSTVYSRHFVFLFKFRSLLNLLFIFIFAIFKKNL